MNELDEIRRALDLAEAGDWDGAHRAVQPLSHPLACQVHACLHREEGDHGNAAYWYARAGVVSAEGTLEEERALLRDALMAVVADGREPVRE